MPVSANTTYVASYLAPGRTLFCRQQLLCLQRDGQPAAARSRQWSGRAERCLLRYASDTAFPTQSFQPANYWVDVIYTATQTYSVGGTIGGPGGAGATVYLNGTAVATTTADANGNYGFSGLANGAYTITPSQVGFTFSPGAQAVTVNNAHVLGVNFNSTQITYYFISGTITNAGGPGATVNLTGAATASTTADAVGNYSFSGLASGNYIVTPSKSGFAYTPANRPVLVNGANVPAVNFSSSTQISIYSISGTITGPGGPGATVSLTGASSGLVTADNSGNYSFNNLPNGNYTVTPSNAGFAFTPGSQAVTIAGASVTAGFDSSVATVQTYTVSGTVNGAGAAGATVNLTGDSLGVVTTDGSGNYSFAGLPSGSYVVTVSNGGYVFTPVSQSVSVNGAAVSGVNFTTISGCPTCNTIWSSLASPMAVDSGDINAAELGVKIRADNDGYITGIRFYKSTANTGTHQAHLWTSSGVQLGSATFASEGATGWQQVLFASPIPVVANITYVASYLAPAGHYSGDNNAFAGNGVDSPPLHALADGIDGPNGVYTYAQGGGFPATASQATNFWVDVIYSSGNGYSIVGAISGPGAAGTTVALSGSSTGTTTTDASGNYSFSGLQNGSYTVTPSHTGVVFTPASQPVTINNGHALNVNFASVQTFSISGTISGAGATGASVALTGNSTAVTTVDGSGNYSFSGLTNGSYTVTPSNAGFFFSPSSQSVTIAGASLTAINFGGSPAVSSVSVTPASVLGGTSATGTVTLGSPASLGGTLVTLSSSNTAAAQVPATVTVAANATTATFTVSTSPVATSASLSISATAGSTVSTSFGVTAPAPTSLNLNPVSVPAGAPSTGTVVLNGPAPTGGATVSLSSSNPSAAQVPATVTVPQNATTATFTVTTSSVGVDTSLTVSASFNGTKSANLTVTSAVLGSATVSPVSVLGGASSTGTVTLTKTAPAGGALVTLSSSNLAAAQVPASVTVAAGATTATFTVATTPVAADSPLVLSATYGTSRTANFTVTAATLSSVALNPTSVMGGTSSTATVTLNGRAATGGAVVTLSSSNPAAQTPASVTVAANATTATFTVTTNPVSSTTTATITGTRGTSRTANLTVTAAALTSVAVSPTSVIGGTPSTGTVRLDGPAPAGGAQVVLSSTNPSAAQVPANVTVSAGATSATFTVTTTPVVADSPLTISATYGRARTASLTVTAATLSSVALNPTSVMGGTSSTGTVTLTGPAPAVGALVTLSSSAPAAAQTPASVSVPAGATTATFNVATSPVATTTTATISGVRGTTRTANLTVTAATLTSVTVNPASVIGGTSSTGTVTLSGPAPATGAVVTLSSNNTAAAQVPASVTIPANATTATFTVTTNPIATNTSPTVSAVYHGTTKTAVLSITAPVLQSLSLNPTTVRGGTTSTGTVTLNGRAPAGGAVVTLSSDLTTVATVPASVTVASGNTTATFTVTTRTVTTTRTVNIRALKSVAITAPLTVTP